VPTRIDKLRQGNYDAILLANAGVSRLQLNLSDLQTKVLDPKSFVPAPAQGVLGLQTRQNDLSTIEVLKKLHHPDVANIIELERGVLKAMDGGCQLPLGVYVADDAVYVAHSKSAQVAAQFYRFESGSQVQQIVAHLNAQP
jgi:hydroxymethylbilane synthase